MQKNSFEAYHQHTFDEMQGEVLKLMQLTKQHKLRVSKLVQYASVVAQHLQYFQKNPPLPAMPLLTSLLAMIDPVTIMALVKSADENKNDIALLEKQFQIVGALLNIDSNLIPYNSADFTSALTDLKRIDLKRLAFTLGDAYGNSKSGTPIGRFLLNWLQQFEPQDFDVLDYDLQVFVTLSLHVVFKWFRFYTKEEQNLLVTRFFYKAVVVGVQIRAILQEFLASSLDSPEYIAKHTAMVAALEANTEPIIINLTTEEKTKLNVLLKKYGNSKAESNLKKELALLYGNFLAAPAFVGWLLETLSIYLLLKKAELVTGDKFEFNDSDKYGAELLELITYAVNKNSWSKIVDYYKKAEVRVPLKNFIKEISTYLDITKEATQQRMAELTAYLQSKRLLNQNDDIIIFSESDGQFHWNEELLNKH